MKKIFYVHLTFLLLFSSIISCKKEPQKHFDIIVSATDTVNPGDLYSAKVYINRGDADFDIEEFYFWDLKMYKDLDTGMVSFKADCFEYTLKGEKGSNFIKKNYKIFIKGNYNGRDTTIELTHFYFLDCGMGKSLLNIEMFTEKDTLTVGERYNGKIFIKEKPKKIKVDKWYYESYELPRIGDTATIKFTVTSGNSDSISFSKKYFKTWVKLVENSDTSILKTKIYYYVKNN